MKKFYLAFLLIMALYLSSCAEQKLMHGAAETPASEIIAEIVNETGAGYVKQSAKLDLDGDGIDEQITAYFSFEGINSIDGGLPYDMYFTCEIVIEKDGAEHTFAWQYSNIRPQLNFADFDTRDDIVQFYFEGDGPSGDPFTQIFSFDGSQIINNTGFPGFITGYDGLGRIYSFDIYSVNSYFDLNNGLTPLPKENIVGTEIHRDFNILLCTNPGDGYTAAILSSYYEEDTEAYTQHFREEFICLVPANTPLVVLDIEFVTNPWDDSGELYPVPWIKARIPDGTEGWFSVAYGD